jgi:sulfur carrier protein
MVNGKEQEFAGGISLAELLRQIQIDPSRPGLAVARNGEVVRRADLAATSVQDGDRIEVVHAVQGG